MLELDVFGGFLRHKIVDRCSGATFCGAAPPEDARTHVPGSGLWSYVSGFGCIICKRHFLFAAGAFVESIEEIPCNAGGLNSFSTPKVYVECRANVQNKLKTFFFKFNGGEVRF